ncbi:O-antigen ligase family protein [Romeria aff. gracilis LEGE 07310]|uniref:O-antigen ligase family protein n=1 Tax=Vasconcelosia minhoensis LEGE 07310 TaxID=915328 RepID=A0A8J7ASM0_9CYAN|nr:O-antigen ligase family protein [Romeria gracilis]MBE9079590.1 O-antigen ligase family protein [Romeria aff. gracilis LEGE 07310]
MDSWTRSGRKKYDWLLHPKPDWLWLAGLVLLPFMPLVSMVWLGSLMLITCYQRAGLILKFLWRQGLIALAVALVASAAFAYDRADAFLQLANFLPFFVLFAVLATLPSVQANPWSKLERLAIALTAASVPISLSALVEYILKFPSIFPYAKTWPGIAWMFDDDFGHRAYSVIGHPNILSQYLILILGLALGLLVQASWRPGSGAMASRRGWLSGAISLCLVGIFCTGSRNGLLIALVQLAIAGYLLRRRRWVLIISGTSAIALLTAAVRFGIGGRPLSLALVTQDPRLQIWQMALDLTRQRPWLGWGLGGFDQLYREQAIAHIPGYPNIYHAHNVWLFLASETGLPVMLGLSLLVGLICYRGVKTVWLGSLQAEQKAVLLSYLLAFGGAILFGCFDVVFFDARVNVLNWTILAAIYHLSQSGQRSRPNPAQARLASPPAVRKTGP